MPPKKKEEGPPKRAILGRPGNTLKMGLVGLPSVGKSATFNLLTNLNVPTGNTFGSVNPNVAQVAIPDPRFDKLTAIFKPKKSTPATLIITDIAGLVPGSSEGKGLGNAFLSHIQGVDGVYNVVRLFEDTTVALTEGEINPVVDMQTVHDELIAKDLQGVLTKIDELERQIKKVADQSKVDELAVLIKVRDLLQKNTSVKDADWKVDEVEILNKYAFLSAKPMVYLLNMSTEDYKKKTNKHLKKIVEWVKTHGESPLIPYSAAFEAELQQAENKEEFCKVQGAPSAVNKMIRIGYKELHLVHFFTVGTDEVKSWTVRENTTAKRAVSVIHTDMEKGFVCANVTKCADLIAAGSEQEAKIQGFEKQQGKEYVVEDGDCIEFKVNVSKKKKK